MHLLKIHIFRNLSIKKKLKKVLSHGYFISMQLFTEDPEMVTARKIKQNQKVTNLYMLACKVNGNQCGLCKGGKAENFEGGENPER